MQRQYRLSKNRQFHYVYRRGSKTACRDLSLMYVKNKQKRVGFSVSKKVGCAVVRNRVKRRLRECVRPLLPSMKKGYYVFVVRPSASLSSYQSLDQSVQLLLRRLQQHQ